MLRDTAARAIHAFHRYFSVKHAPVAEEVRAASESASKAIKAAETNAAANERLAQEMTRLDGLMRSGGQ